MKSIQDLAREAGLYTHKEVQPELQCFATLVIEQEHARLLEGSGEPAGVVDGIGRLWAADGHTYINGDKFYNADQMAAAVLRERAAPFEDRQSVSRLYRPSATVETDPAKIRALFEEDDAC